MTTEDKRERLTEAARTLFYQQGFYRTTLADVAQQAGVPLGNVYYHFKTKEALVEAVIEAHLQEARASFALWERDPDPRQRLKSLAQAGRAFSAQLIRYGCPYASLCEELEKDENQLAQAAAHLLQLRLDWAEQQFRLLGKGDEAPDLAVDLIAAIQGTYLLTHSLRSSDLLTRKIERLEAWIDTRT